MDSSWITGVGRPVKTEEEIAAARMEQSTERDTCLRATEAMSDAAALRLAQSLEPQVCSRFELHFSSSHANFSIHSMLSHPVGTFGRSSRSASTRTS